jgi:hypothetical protein
MTRVLLTPAQRGEIARGRFVRIGRAFDGVVVGRVQGQ